jgi:hypothetical protein
MNIFLRDHFFLFFIFLDSGKYRLHMFAVHHFFMNLIMSSIMDVGLERKVRKLGRSGKLNKNIFLAFFRVPYKLRTLICKYFTNAIRKKIVELRVNYFDEKLSIPTQFTVKDKTVQLTPVYLTAILTYIKIFVLRRIHVENIEIGPHVVFICYIKSYYIIIVGVRS